ncbi:MAG: hypothetical protein ACRCV6_09740 [Formosimonas sp.]
MSVNWVLYECLRQIPKDSRVALQADYIELMAMSSIDKSCRISSYDDLIDEDNAFSIEDEQHRVGGVSVWDNDDGEEVQLSKKHRELHYLFEQRSKSWTDKWPFEWNANDCELKFCVSRPYARLYASFLLCSSLRVVDKTQFKYFTTFLEEAGYYALQKIFPNWVVKGFGANQVIGNCYSHTTQQQKFTALADDIDCHLAPNFQPNFGGDGGLDIVAFYTWDDKRGQLPFVCAQCSCSSDKDQINKKITEASPSSVKNKLVSQLDNFNFFISPQDLSSSQRRSNWSVDNIWGAIIVDRYRLMKLLADNLFSNTLDGKVEEFINLKINFEAVV